MPAGRPPASGDHAALIAAMRQHPWYVEEPSRGFVPRAPRMILDAECQLLHWLAARAYSGRGDIADLGAFLGASTEAFGRGARHNRKAPFGRRIIHSFDLFLCPRDAYSKELIGHGRAPGDSILDLYQDNVAAISDLVEVYPGDVLRQSWRGGGIEILFVDIAKTHQINDRLLEAFFPRLTGPGAVVIHQDYNHPWLPWVHWTAQAMRPYCEYICDLGGSRVQVVARPVPAETWVGCQWGRMSGAARRALLEREIAQNENRYSAAMVAMGLAWLTFLEEGLAPGLAMLDPGRQPLLAERWVPEQVEAMRQSMTAMGDVEGYERYHAELFAAQPSGG
ncbi:MAG TPA: hypothetical protein VFA23_16535 [Dongiaceae bacterium]|nr:hypothetical protein [Dongiaceae bacterium]